MTDGSLKKSKMENSNFQGVSLQRKEKGKGPEPLRRAIAECTQPHIPVGNLACEPSHTLEDYLGNTATTDVAYSLLLDHARAEQARSPPVLVKSVALLKKYLFRYYPSVSMLQQIDAFCVEFIAEHKAAASGYGSLLASGNVRTVPGAGPSPEASASLLKSLHYVRAVVARFLPADAVRFKTEQSVTVLPRESVHNAREGPASGWGLKRGSPRGHSAVWEDANTTTQAMAQLMQLPDNPDNYVFSDLMKARWLGGLRSRSPAPLLQDIGGSRPNAITKSTVGNRSAAASLLGIPAHLEEQAGQLLHCDSVTGVIDKGLARSHVRSIAASKRARNVVFTWRDFDSGQNTIRKRMQRPLFQYRYYGEQQPLKLTEGDMEEVVAAVCSMDSSLISGDVSTPESSGQDSWSQGGPATGPLSSNSLEPDPGDIAASVLIKLFIDMYLADPVSATPLAFSLLQNLLESDVAAVRVRAFDLVLNLGVHAHLLEPIPADESLSFHSLGANKLPLDEGSDVPPAHKAFEEWLRGIICEMLLFLLQVEEREEQVWAAALSCLLYFTCDHGRILRIYLTRLDIRVVEALLAIGTEHGWAEELQTHLIRLLTSLLYWRPTGGVHPKIELDLQQLESIGGVHFICDQFATSSSKEARRNLFAVLLDYAVEQLRDAAQTNGMPPPSDQDISSVGAALALVDVQESLVTAFRVRGLPGGPVGASLLGEIAKSPMDNLPKGHLNVELLNEVMGILDRLADEHTRVAPELEPLVAATMISSGKKIVHVRENSHNEPAWAILTNLLHSSRGEDRRMGRTWLLQLLAVELPELSLPPTPEHSKDSNALLHGASADLSKDVSGTGKMTGGSGWTSADEGSGSTSKSPSRAVKLAVGLLSSKSASVRQSYLILLDGLLLLQCAEKGTNSSHAAKQEKADSLLSLLSAGLWQVYIANETACINILKMCNMLLWQLCVPGALPTAEVISIPTANPRASRIFANRSPGETEFWTANAMEEHTSIARLFLLGRWVASRRALAKIPAAVLCWPLVQLAPSSSDQLLLATAVGSHGTGGLGGAADVRAAMLLLLVGKCTDSPAVLTELGGLEFFRSLLDDPDARIAYFSSTFLLKKMMEERAEDYERALHKLVFTAQQSNNEKLLENPYLQVRGLIEVLADT